MQRLRLRREQSTHRLCLLAYGWCLPISAAPACVGCAFLRRLHLPASACFGRVCPRPLASVASARVGRRRLLRRLGRESAADFAFADAFVQPAADFLPCAASRARPDAGLRRCLIPAYYRIQRSGRTGRPYKIRVKSVHGDNGKMIRKYACFNALFALFM